MIQTLGYDAQAKEFEADVAIIGSGAIGLAMATDFLGKGVKVLVLEAGEGGETASSDELYDAEIVGHSFNGTTLGRRRVFGGSTTLWGGQFLPLGDIVFEDRPWLGVSGWPLSKLALAPFFVRAAEKARVSSRMGDETIWREHGVEPPRFDAERLVSEFSRFSPAPNFASNFRAEIERSREVDALLNAAVVEVRLDANEAVDHVVVRSLDGHEAKVRARAFVLAAGAIESPRILLASNRQDPRGLGNRADHIGRYFQDHVSLVAARVVPHDRSAFHDLYDNFVLDATKYAPKIALSDTLQREEKLLNVGGFFRFPTGGEEGVAALKTLVGHLKRRTRPNARAVGTTLANLPEVARFLYGVKAKHRIRASRRGEILLEGHAEQLPTRESRIVLSPNDDALGMARARVDWRIDDASRSTLKRYVETVRDEFARTGIARVEPLDVFDRPEAFQNAASDVYHHMGTVRMSADPADGVVDPDGRMHEVSNLYVAGCSVFPVSGYSNPTHTALALALRLGDHLRQGVLRGS